MVLKFRSTMPQTVIISRSKKIIVGLFSLFILFTLAALMLWLEKPTGSLRGVIVREDGKPLANTKINIDYYPSETRIDTDAQGRFQISNIPVANYYLHFYTKGYQPNYLSGPIEIKEGQTRDLGKIALKELEPNLYVDLWSDTKTPDEKVTLTLSGAKVRQVQFTAYRLPLLDYLRQGGNLDDLSTSEFDPSRVSGIELIQEWNEEIPTEDIPEFNRRVSVKLPDKGVFLIHAVASSLDRQKVFTHNRLVNKTDLGFVVKRDDERVVVYAASFQNSQPVAEAQLFLIHPDGKVQQSVTNQQGLAEIALEASSAVGQRTPALLLQYQGSTAFLYVPRGFSGEETETDVEGVTDSARRRVFLYTDRPLYRPGQRVYFKGIVRTENRDGQYEIGDVGPIAIRVETPKGDPLYETTVNANAMGSFWGEFDLGDEGDLGFYNLVAEMQGQEFQQDFEVEEYRKPEFKLEIKPDKPFYYPDETISFSIDAQYYFGAPLETEVEYTVYQTPFYFSASDETPYYPRYGEEEGPIGGYGEVLAEGKVQTDVQGHAVVLVKVPKSSHDQRITLRATAQDVTARTVTSENDAFVREGDFYFRTQIMEFFAKAEEQVPVSVVARSYDGKPLKKEYRLELAREKWDPVTNAYRYHKREVVKGETGENGIGTSAIRFPQGGYYRLLVSGKDEAGRKVSFEDHLWVSGSAEDTQDYGLQQGLVMLAQKKSYEAGEEAQLFVVGKHANEKFLVTVESSRLHEYRVEQLEGYSKLISIPLKKEWIPNVFVTVSAIGKKEYDEASTEIGISPAERFLTVEIKPNQSKYPPGDLAVYRVVTRDHSGKPTPAEISFGVVDESLYALRRDTTNIQEFFWGARPNRVSGNYSFSGYYTGGIEKEDQKLLRRNFKDTACWVPWLMTDEKGVANVRCILPDNLTTWRATAIAQTTQTDVGQQTNKVVATKDLLVRLTLPRFFTERDEAVLTAIVQNYTPKVQTLKVSLGFTGLEFKNPSDAQDHMLTVEAGKTASFQFPVIAKLPGEAKIQIFAKNDSAYVAGATSAKEAQLSDGFELKVPVLPHGSEDHQYAQGEIPPSTGVSRAESRGSEQAPSISETAPSAQAATVDLAIPPQVNIASTQLKVTLDTTLVGQLLESLSYLLGYPYGCVEQTTSRLLSSLTLYHLYQTLGFSDPMLEKKVPEIVRKSVRRLSNMQHSDGGWGWWSNDNPQPFMTAYALYGLLRVRELDFSVADEMLQKAKDSLVAQLQTGGSWERPRGDLDSDQTLYFAHYVAALAGLQTQVPMPSSYQLSSNLAQAFLILTLEAQGRHEEVIPWLTHLEQAAVCETVLCHFSDGEKSYRGDAEVTAWALLALLQAHSENEVLKGDIVQWLLKNRQGGIWQQTQSTTAVVNALAAYSKDQPGAVTGVKAKLSLNGKEVEAVDVAAAHFSKNLTSLSVQVGKNKFDIFNLLSQALYYQTDLKFFTQEEDLAPVAQGIKVQREYFRLRMREDKLKGEKFYEIQAFQGKIAKGELLGVRLTLESSNPLSYIVIEDPLPAGFEVIKDLTFDKDVAYTTEIDIHDEHIAMFRTYLEAGAQIFNYVIRPEIAGSFHVMPTRSFEMYRPEVRGASAEGRLEVE